tara:strand:- start:108 stop:332 length:225 start_codon:yes stop_codon:yes gene_type:complete
MVKARLPDVGWIDINDRQREDLDKLLKDYKTNRFVEFKSFDIVQIIIGGIIYDLTKQVYKNYKEMIKDILEKKQ